jgi:hypothetical protein
MEVRSFDDAKLFSGDAMAYVDTDPFSSSVIAVQIDGVVHGIRTGGEHDRYWSVVDGDHVSGIAMHTPPHNLFLARMPADAASALAESLAATRPLSGVNGQTDAVVAFCDRWLQLTGQPSSTLVAMRMYRLGELIAPVGVPGAGRLVEPGDLEVVAGWLEAFHDEAQPHGPVGDWKDLAKHRIAAGQFQIWEDDHTVVSMAGFSHAVAGVSRVAPVYTPPFCRRRGYGAAVTSGATAAALAGGATHVVLYTDLSNPTSNSIYQAIGYRADHDAQERALRS